MMFGTMSSKTVIIILPHCLEVYLNIFIFEQTFSFMGGPESALFLKRLKNITYIDIVDNGFRKRVQGDSRFFAPVWVSGHTEWKSRLDRIFRKEAFMDGN